LAPHSLSHQLVRRLLIDPRLQHRSDRLRQGPTPEASQAMGKQQVTEHGDGLQLSSRRSARLNNYFLIVCHHDDLAAKVIHQRMRKTVYHVSFVPQIG
jgi:hypothetical protein